MGLADILRLEHGEHRGQILAGKTFGDRNYVCLSVCTVLFIFCICTFCQSAELFRIDCVACRIIRNAHGCEQGVAKRIEIRISGIGAGTQRVCFLLVRSQRKVNIPAFAGVTLIKLVNCLINSLDHKIAASVRQCSDRAVCAAGCKHMDDLLCLVALYGKGVLSVQADKLKPHGREFVTTIKIGFHDCAPFLLFFPIPSGSLIILYPSPEVLVFGLTMPTDWAIFESDMIDLPNS